jgi:hypothetical protein
MSTKIVSTPSQPLNGEINEKDLHEIFEDYHKLIKLDSTTSRHFKKSDGFFITIDILKAFIEEAEKAGPDYTKIYCKFGVTLPHQTSCLPPFADIANNLTATFFIADKNDKLKNHVGDGVLTAGFKASQIHAGNLHKKEMLGGNLDCCANPIPPTP